MLAKKARTSSTAPLECKSERDSDETSSDIKKKPKLKDLRVKRKRTITVGERSGHRLRIV